MKSRMTAGVLALFLGGIGVHHFYLGNGGRGILYFLFCWTFIPALVALVEALILFTMSDDVFNAKYNQAFMNRQPIMVNVSSPSAHSPDLGHHAPDPLEQIGQLQRLKDSGALTDQEFAAKKAQLLGLGLPIAPGLSAVDSNRTVPE